MAGSKLDKLEQKIDRTKLHEEKLKEAEQQAEKQSKALETKEETKEDNPPTEEKKPETKAKATSKKKEAPKKSLFGTKARMDRVTASLYIYKHLDDKLQALADQETEYLQSTSDGDVKPVTKGQILELILDEYFTEKNI